MIPEEEWQDRKDELVDAMRAWSSNGSIYGCHEDFAQEALYGLLKHLDKNDPEVAKALRFGIAEKRDTK